MKEKIYPVLNTALCTHCELCTKVCPAGAVDLEAGTIIKENCMRCGHCTAICPVSALTMAGFTGELLAPLAENAGAVFADLMKRRRSIRRYTAQRIPEEVIKQIISMVSYAPTGTNSQKVKITVINSPEKLKEFSDMAVRFFDRLLKMICNPLTYPFLWLFGGEKAIRRISRYKQFIKRYLDGENVLTYDAPALFVFHVPQKSSTPEQDGVIWATAAVYYAETLGLGSCFNGFLVQGINRSKLLQRYLGIPKGNKVYATCLLGYPQYQFKRSIPRELPEYRIISS